MITIVALKELELSAEISILEPSMLPRSSLSLGLTTESKFDLLLLHCGKLEETSSMVMHTWIQYPKISTL